MNWQKAERLHAPHQSDRIAGAQESDNGAPPVVALTLGTGAAAAAASIGVVTTSAGSNRSQPHPHQAILFIAMKHTNGTMRGGGGGETLLLV